MRHAKRPVTRCGTVKNNAWHGAKESGGMPRKKSETPVNKVTPVNNLVVISDLHCGCRMGLYPCDTDVILDEGVRYVPSEFQRAVWHWWVEFWKWVEVRTNGEPWDLVINGDATDGVHHGATTQISHNLTDQAAIARAVLEPIVAQARKYYHIRGTEAHVGKSGQEEERLAFELGAIPNKAGQYARYDLWKLVGEQNRARVHLSHHIGTTGSQAYESTAVLKELVESYVEAGRWGLQPPDVVVRSHRHRAIKVEIPTENTDGISMVTPGWQGKTPFVWRLPGGRQSEPQFGGVLIREAPDGVWFTTSFVRSLKREEPEV